MPPRRSGHRENDDDHYQDDPHHDARDGHAHWGTPKLTRGLLVALQSTVVRRDGEPNGDESKRPDAAEGDGAGEPHLETVWVDPHAPSEPLGPLL